MKRENLNTPINYLHSQSRPNRTPKQHKMLLERIVKIVRLFKPDDGSSFPEWFTKIRNRYALDEPV